MNIETIIVGPLATNCYIVSSGDEGEALIIDPGGDAGKIKAYIESSDLAPVLIVLTHGHSDHMEAAPELARHYGIDIAIHGADIPTLERSIADAPAWGLPRPEATEPGRLLSAGDEIVFGGGSCRVLHTPGHTMGGISIVTDGCVFAGDTLFAGSIGRTDFFGGDMETIIRSIREQLFPLPDDTVVYTGHGPATTIGEEKRHNPFLTGGFV